MPRRHAHANEPAFPIESWIWARHPFYPNGKFVFAVSELSSTATSFAYDVKKGRSRKLERRRRCRPDSPRNDVAETAVHPNGKFLYVSTGETTASRFFPSIRETELSRGRGTPTGERSAAFCIDPSGKYLLAENQFSNNIVVFKIDPATGGLTLRAGCRSSIAVDIAFLQEN